MSKSKKKTDDGVMPQQVYAQWQCFEVGEPFLLGFERPEEAIASEVASDALFGAGECVGVYRLVKVVRVSRHESPVLVTDTENLKPPEARKAK